MQLANNYDLAVTSASMLVDVKRVSLNKDSRICFKVNQMVPLIYSLCYGLKQKSDEHSGSYIIGDREENLFSDKEIDQPERVIWNCSVLAECKPI